eukprot:1143479-Pelagomonas_calceolata.AAC.1
MSLPHLRVRGKLVWVWWVFGSMCPQGTRGMGSVDRPTHTQKDCVESDLSTSKLFAQFTLQVVKKSSSTSVRESELGPLDMCPMLPVWHRWHIIRERVSHANMGMTCCHWICPHAYKTQTWICQPQNRVPLLLSELDLIEHLAQPPLCYGALVKREEGDNKEEVPGLNPCGRGGEKDALFGGSCQYHIISSMKTERHNIAGRMIIKALSKSPWGAGLVTTDIGSDDRLCGGGDARLF